MSGLLIVTCGTTDLQLVARGTSGEAVRLAVAQDAQRALHEKLLDGSLPYSVDPEAEALPFRPDATAGLEDDLLLQLSSSTKGAQVADGEIVTPLRVVPAKLASLPVTLAGKDAPDTVVVFNTRRDGLRGEPVAAGQILATWLAEAFGLAASASANELAPGVAGWVDYLQGNMRAEGAEGAPVNADAVQHMDDALRGFGRGWQKVVLAISGGIPAYRDEIRALVRFRFPNADIREFVQPREGGGTVTPAPSWSRPSESFRLRGQAIKLVRKGDIFGAATLAEQLEKDETAAWVREVGHARDLLTGMHHGRGGSPAYLQPFIGESVPRCLLPAVRTEVALRCGQVAEALIWTFAFRDAALNDAIASLDFVQEFDELAKMIVQIPGRPPPKSLLSKVAEGRFLNLKKWEGGSPPRWLFFRNEEADAVWKQQTGTVGGLVERLDKRLTEGRGGDYAPKSYRNALSHSVVPPDQMRKVKRLCTDLGVWLEPAHGRGVFLSQPEVVGILEALGVEQPFDLYTQMVEGLAASLEAHRVAPDS